MFIVATVWMAKVLSGSGLVNPERTVPVYYMGWIIKLEKVTQVQHCGYIWCIKYKYRPIGVKHDQLLANDKLLNCLDCITDCTTKFQMHLDFSDEAKIPQAEVFCCFFPFS